MSTSNKYTRLVSNTVLLGVSSFSSKILSFLLTRLYTGVLTEATYGVVDLVTAVANLAIPMVSLGIANAIIRFGLEKNINKKSIFTDSITAILCGFVGMLVLWPVLAQVSVLNSYLPLLYAYVLASCLRNMCCQFVRAQQRIRLYAIDGILSTLYTVGFNILYLVVLDLGANGFLLAIISADLLSAIGLFFFAKLRRYVSLRAFDKKLLKTMLRYSLPLVPASMFWWITNSSDRFFIAYMVGTAANGLYAAAYKVPSIVTLVSTIFTEAWQISAFTEGEGKERERFFSQIFEALMGVSFIMGGALIIGCRLIMRFLVAPGYFSAWQFIPFLVIGTVFSMLVAFLNSVYMVRKKSSLSLITMMVGAILNIILNALFIPLMGANGAGFATFISYLVVFIIRAVNTRRLIAIRFNPAKIAINTFLLLCMSLIMIFEVPMWYLWSGLVLAVVLAINAYSLYKGVMQLVRRKTSSKV